MAESLSSLSEIQEKINHGVLTHEEVVRSYLSTIEKKTHLNAFLEVYKEESLRRARDLDAKKKAGQQLGKLAGMVVGIKDVLCYQNHHLQASSKILDGFIAQFNATAVERLLQEDAIIIGRQNCDEFAMGSSNENSSFGNVLNEIATDRVPGGSSGGSAVAVQADLCLVSLGSDTGGSVRQPAAFCGVIGLKPTYSRISRHGLIAYASSFDTIGIIGKNIPDIALVLEVIAGKDEWDSTVSHREVPAYSRQLTSPSKLKIAYIEETLSNKGLHPIIQQKTYEKINFLKQEGHDVEAVHFPFLDCILPTYYILTTAEASSNLSRFDGVRYGYREGDGASLEEMYKKTRTHGFGQEVKRRILLGTFVLSAGYYDAYYTKAQKVRRLIKEKTDELFQTYDFIILPTTPTTAFKIGAHTQNALEMYLADLFTVQANVAGIPAISIPNGEDADGLPIGLQLMARPFEEERLLALAAYILNIN